MAANNGQQAQQTWNIKQILDWTCGFLERHGDEHPRLSAEWLLCDVMGLSRVELYVNYDKPLNEDERARMREAVRRRAAGEPLQYVTGETAFRHIVLRCEKGVLIPRPETEVLVDAALEGVDAAAAAAGGLPCRVLEVGCGTGCISLSLAYERPGTKVTATDLSPAAIDLATRNRASLGLDDAVDLVECDLASGVDPALAGTFAVLVSNPPYIPTAVLVDEVPPEVKDNEPELALDGGADGLDVFRRLLELAPGALCPGGMLACELYEGHLDQAAELVRNAGGWASVEVREDLARRPRVLVAVREGKLPASSSVAAEKIVRVDPADPDPAVVARVAEVLADGGVAVLPTDSVYGLSCAVAPNNPAHRRIFDIKRRDLRQTLPWFVSREGGLDRWGRDVPDYARALAKKFWPGALTLVVRAADDIDPEYLQAADPLHPAAGGTVALRAPGSELIEAVLAELDAPLAQTSANLHGKPAATSAAELDPALVCAADLVVDGGEAPLAEASTIVDCTGAVPVILRPGAIPAAAILAACAG
ncbi:peptide chain release factor N(5)-glutamine methyltransferase [Paratractidigestivibacter sp.]|uniref:peptide chain release factor N(5)-glutamine methyltransferase n=1 Tax=Paratractidigestivibacter sp. TaxID=2847316 RepID=UPI002ACB1264|nr:peptide chain release factor N(5)-glutamine methyltransferase [Paratractidigestivibacter sp.]